MSRTKKNLENKPFLNRYTSITFVLVIMFTLLMLYMPKIYLRNNIYYMSRDINSLYQHYISLKEENRFLSQQLEDMKFKNQIMDSLILYDLEQK